jgi:Mlc titration factor MtfA (ptsG expression regulator)/Tfp pilus assembly protein PilF
MLASWWKNRRRRRILARPFPAEWARLLERRVRHYRHLPAPRQRLVEQIVQVMVAEKEWAGAAGLVVSTDMRVTIAGQAAIMASGFAEPYFFDRLHTLVVHPGTVRFTPEQSAANPLLPGPDPLDGVAWHRGPVVLSWARVRRELSGHAPGHNVVLHEFAHHLDGLCGEMDGAPPLGDPQRERRWYAVTEAEFLRLVGSARRDEATLLDHYGAKNRAEFFAVSTECFFELPHELRERHGELYEALADFYRQSPADWLPRREAAPAENGAAAGQFVDVGRRERHRDDFARLRAVQAMPVSDALFSLGLEQLRLGQAEEAVRIFTRLIEHDARDEESLAQRAIAHLQLGDRAAARADCDAALAIDPADVDALCVRGEILLDQGDARAALADLNDAVLAAPRDAQARVSRSRAWLALGGARKALADANEALKSDPYLAEAHHQRGRANQALGRTKAADQDFLRARLLEPHHAWHE